MVQLIRFEANRLTVLYLTAVDRQPYLPGLIKSLVEKYSFAIFPKTIEEIGEKIVFRQGVFRDTGIDELDFYTDGIVISSRSDSDFLDEFLEDLSEWRRSHGVSSVETHKINKTYDSQIVFKSDVDIPKKLYPADHIAKSVSVALREATGIEAAYQSFGFSLSADASKFPGLKPGAFQVERRLGLPFDSNIYFSAAPLPTKAHLKILDNLEKL